jgi:hypothetical protein
MRHNSPGVRPTHLVAEEGEDQTSEATSSTGERGSHSGAANNLGVVSSGDVQHRAGVKAIPGSHGIAGKEGRGFE